MTKKKPDISLFDGYLTIDKFRLYMFLGAILLLIGSFFIPRPELVHISRFDNEIGKYTANVKAPFRWRFAMFSTYSADQNAICLPAKPDDMSSIDIVTTNPAAFYDPVYSVDNTLVHQITRASAEESIFSVNFLSGFCISSTPIYDAYNALLRDTLVSVLQLTTSFTILLYGALIVNELVFFFRYTRNTPEYIRKRYSK